jgi:hypothetical protein
VKDAFASATTRIRENQDRFAVLNLYHISLFGYYLDKLRSTRDGDGSLLDHVLLMYGAGMSDSNAHDPNNLPILLVGGADVLKGGRHLRNTPETTMSNLLVAMLDKLDIPTEKFGDSTGMLSI